MRKSGLILLFGLIVLLALSMLALGCADDGGNNGGDDDQPSGPISGTLVLGGDGVDYKMPTIYEKEIQTLIVFHNSSGIYYQAMDASDPQAVDMMGSTSVPWSVGQYAMNENYFVWNVADSYRHRWNGTTEFAQTGSLVPGLCISRDLRDLDVLVGTRPGGQLYKIALSTFTDPKEREPITLVDPGTSISMSVGSFTCKGSVAIVGTTDGRLFKVNLDDANPTAQKLAEGQHFGGVLQYADPWVAWVDQETNDIMTYNFTDAAVPAVAVNVDPLNTNAALIVDLRLFGTVLVWSDNSNGNYDLWAADLETMNDENDYIQVTNEANDQRYPFLHGSEIYWEDHRNGDFAEIWKGTMPAL